MLYKIRQGADIFEDNPGLRAVEAFDKLTDKQMKVVLLVCDPSKDNPIKTLSGKDRRERACVLAGYPLEDGKRLAKNARDIVDGKVASIETAIEVFKKNHYNEREKNKEALRKQIAEIRDFLTEDKRVPVIAGKGLILKNDKGEEVWAVDQKGLKLAAELGERLPNLEEALEKLEALDPQDTKFEGTTFTSQDFSPEILDSEENLSTIDMAHQQGLLNKNESKD
jgi:hypothetical protein